MDYRHVMETDPELFKAIADEVQRQREHIELIASENFVSPAVMEAMGSPLTNKYAEGYPAKRYYGGCQYVDVAENLARDRAKLLFGAEHANVDVYKRQAHLRRPLQKHETPGRHACRFGHALSLQGDLCQASWRSAGGELPAGDHRPGFGGLSAPKASLSAASAGRG